MRLVPFWRNDLWPKMKTRFIVSLVIYSSSSCKRTWHDMKTACGLPSKLNQLVSGKIMSVNH